MYNDYQDWVLTLVHKKWENANEVVSENNVLLACWMYFNKIPSKINAQAH